MCQWWVGLLSALNRQAFLVRIYISAPTYCGLSNTCPESTTYLSAREVKRTPGSQELPVVHTYATRPNHWMFAHAIARIWGLAGRILAGRPNLPLIKCLFAPSVAWGVPLFLAFSLCSTPIHPFLLLHTLHFFSFLFFSIPSSPSLLYPSFVHFLWTLPIFLAF